MSEKTESKRASDQWWYEKPRHIYKYVLPLPLDTNEHPVSVEVPAGADILQWGVDPATDNPAFWAKVNPEAEKVTLRFLFRLTGEQVQMTHMHEATIIKNGIVLHVFRYIPWADMYPGYEAVEGEV